MIDVGGELTARAHTCSNLPLKDIHELLAIMDFNIHMVIRRKSICKPALNVGHSALGHGLHRANDIAQSEEPAIIIVLLLRYLSSMKSVE